MIEAFEAFPDEAVLLEAASRLERLEKYQQSLLLLERYFTVSRSPAGRVTARESLKRVQSAINKTSAEVRITSDPKHAEICIGDDHERCEPSPVRTWLTAGEHTIRVQHPGLSTRTYVAKIEAGKHQSIRVRLQPHVPAGRLEVFSDVADAAVQVDGKEIGLSPITDFSLPAGIHLIEVQRQAGHTWKQQVVVEPGRTATIYAGVAPPTLEATNAGDKNDTKLITPEPVVTIALVPTTHAGH